jgi:DNA-binding CsgD family transcriptional regulator
LGYVEAARAAVDEADATVGAIRVWELEVRVGEAWTWVATGERSRAESNLLGAVDDALDNQEFGTATFALHELARLGAPAPALERLEHIDIESDRAELARQYCRAALAEDGPALDELAQRFADRGADLLAAECGALASDAYATTGLRIRQLESRQRALGWLTNCGGARTPSLMALEAPELGYLTTREREVAEMAATGRTRAEIGERLGVTDRTVANHLTHIYAKLNVSSRAELAKLLGIPAL